MIASLTGRGPAVQHSPMVPRRLLAAAFAAVASLAAVPAAAEAKVALVIGNAAYPVGSLRNPVNDATAMAKRLKAAGFDVTLRTNVTQREMTRAVSQFGEALKPGSVGLFYYAGHGMQVRGRNFLVPVDAQILSEASARSEAVDLDLVLEQLGPARLGVVILDACRNNPFEGKFRSGSGNGLAQVDAPKGTLLAYATAPGKVASDGEGEHGLYTAELLKAMDMPGAKVEEVFKSVRVNVIKATSGLQVPWESSSLTGDFYFRPAAAEAATGTREAQAQQAELQSKLEAERLNREKEQQALKAEMEKLREEVRRLSLAAAPSQTPAESKPPAQAPKAAEATAPATAAPTPKGSPASSRLAENLRPPSGAKPGARRNGDLAASQLALREPAGHEWNRRLATLEGQRGQLTFSKAAAILLAPLSDEQLMVLVGKERALRDMPYSSALALGVNPKGGLAGWRTWGERTPAIASETAAERCRRHAVAACHVVMLNGTFNEPEFLAWARGATGKSILQLRIDLLRLRTEGR